MARKQTAFDKLSGRDPEDTLAYRDVFEGQQLDRSKIEGKRSKTSRTVVAVVVGVLVSILVWVAYSW